MMSVVLEIGQVPMEIRNAVLHHYILKCHEMYDIAFFQHRFMHPYHDNIDKKALEEIILKRINAFYNNLHDH